MSSPVPLRRLSQELVRLRKTAGLTVDQVTVALDWSTGRLTYMERGKWQRADVGNVEQLLNLYEVEGGERESLLNLARQSRVKGWWAAYRDLFPASLPGFEEAATWIRTYESNVVPGLLQTEDYAKAIVRGFLGDVIDPTIIERKAEARRARQQILERDQPSELWAIIDEAALLRLVGGAEVMCRQIHHLIEMAAWPHITIQILPNSAGAHAGLDGGAFVILDFAATADRSLVYLGGATASLFLEKPEDVQGYNLIFSRMMTSELTPDESVSHMITLRNQLS
jgi:hypothetical protein